MQRLNFYPIYETYLRAKKKTTTLRLGNYSLLRPGDEVLLSIGWEEDKATPLHPGVIKAVYRRRIDELNNEDFRGESPDCKTVETAKLALGCIYKTTISDSDEVWVIKFDHA